MTSLGPPLHVVSFDLDGTFADTSLDLAEALNRVRRELGETHRRAQLKLDNWPQCLLCIMRINKLFKSYYQGPHSVCYSCGSCE